VVPEGAEEPKIEVPTSSEEAPKAEEAADLN